MNIHKMIAELQAEKQRLDEAILALERLSAGSLAKRRPKLAQARETEDPQDQHPEASEPLTKHARHSSS